MAKKKTKPAKQPIDDRLYVYHVFEDLAVVDGDTAKGIIDYGFGTKQTNCYFRFDGIDAPEVHKKKTAYAGQCVASLLVALMRKYSFCMRSVQKPEKYGRCLVELLFSGMTTGSEFVDWTSFCITNGLAKPYNGEKKQEWTAQELRDCVETVHNIAAAYELALPDFHDLKID